MFGIPTGRLILYGSAAALLLGLNFWRFGEAPVGPAERQITQQGQLPELPQLAAASDFTGFTEPARRNLFRAGEAKPPEPEPEPVKAEAPKPDPEAQARQEAERMLDKVRVIGFLSTTGGVMAVMTYEGSVVSVLAGDAPVPGFTVSDVTIDSVTLEHGKIDLSRTFGLGDAE